MNDDDNEHICKAQIKKSSDMLKTYLGHS